MKAASLFDHAVATSPLRGESESGDTYVVRSSNGFGLVAVIDVLGHGKEAAVVARQATQALKAGPILSVEQHLINCHAVLKGTRGAVMVLACLDGHAGRMTWSGVGDAEGVLIRATDTDRNDHLKGPNKHNVVHVPTRPGIVGSMLPITYLTSLDLAVGDILIMTTDGIKDGYVKDVDITDDLQHIADNILSSHSKDHDDSLVLVLRWKGLAHPSGPAKGGE